MRPTPPRPTPTRGSMARGDGQSSRLCYTGHLLMENANAPIVDAALTRASGTAEREAALAMLGRRSQGRRITLGADKAYGRGRAFVDALRDRSVDPAHRRRRPR